jgi:hypothetical protein
LIYLLQKVVTVQPVAPIPLVKHLVFIFVASNLSAQARPVSFVGSTMAMAQIQPSMSLVSADYTFGRRISLGAQYQWLKRASDEIDFAGPEINVLLFRHNALDWQANIFLSGAFGAAFEAKQPLLAGVALLEADAESRRLYGLVSARFLQSGSGLQDFQMTARVGLAPVLAEANEINPWFILQYQYMPQFTNVHVVSPVMRLLYQGFLFEAGMSLRGEVFFNVAAELL